jgi:hypothetical protein
MKHTSSIYSYKALWQLHASLKCIENVDQRQLLLSKKCQAVFNKTEKYIYEWIGTCNTVMIWLKHIYEPTSLEYCEVFIFFGVLILALFKPKLPHDFNSV